VALALVRVEGLPEARQGRRPAAEVPQTRLEHAAIAGIHIERKPGKVVVTVHTGRPGVVIGKKGAEVDKLRDELAQLSGKEVGINVEEIKRPEVDAQLVADNVANQLAQRISFRRAMKRAVQSAMRMGAQGIKIKCSGRLGGAEIARVEGYHEGRVPLHTLRADIDYAQSTARTTFGAIGVKVWMFKGEVVEDRRGKTYSTGVQLNRRREEKDDPEINRSITPPTNHESYAESEAVKFRKMFRTHQGSGDPWAEISFGHYGLQASNPVDQPTGRSRLRASRSPSHQARRQGLDPSSRQTDHEEAGRNAHGKGKRLARWVAVVEPGRVRARGVTREIAEKAMALAAAQDLSSIKFRGPRPMRLREYRQIREAMRTSAPALPELEEERFRLRFRGRRSRSEDPLRVLRKDIARLNTVLSKRTQAGSQTASGT
jgi:small subunit ribosomal protein S3